MKLKIPYARHQLDQADKDAVLRVLDSDRLTQGPEVDAFEQEFAKKVEAPYAVAFSSGTAALHAACFVAGVEPGTTVLTSALGFVASANAPKYLGAEVAFADIGEDWNMPQSEWMGFADAVIPVHFAGLPAFAGPAKVPAIEDACHALGAKTEDGPVGNCAHSDFCCFSLHPSKAITTGEGGMVTCRRKNDVKALKRFRNHGFVLSGGWWREQIALGFNYRMSELHAALGRSQLAKLDSFISQRHTIAGRYLEELNGVVKLPPYSPHHAWHLFVIRIPERNRVYEELKKRGIETQVHYVSLYRNSFHSSSYQVVADGQTLIDPSDFPNTEAYFSECLSLPIHPSLTKGEQTRIIEAVKEVV